METEPSSPGRSLLAEMTELKEQMTNLRAAMLQLVELQREVNTKVENALTHHNGGGVG
jgi:hypothetical protein